MTIAEGVEREEPIAFYYDVFVKGIAYFLETSGHPSLPFGIEVRLVPIDGAKTQLHRANFSSF